MNSDRPRDMWPLGLMLDRAGREAPAVEVATPGSHEEVQALLRSGRRLVPAGGASGVCGALDPGPGDVVVDLSRLDRWEIDAANMTVRVQAGLTGLELEKRLNERGLTLGHFPSSLPIASVGGLVSTRSSGQQSTMYGSVEDMIVGLTVALPGGQLMEARVHPRTAAGPPLEMLFVGAEGGLGIVLDAVLRVHRLPEAVLGGGWRVPGVHEGLEMMREVLQRGLRPLVLRLYDPEDSVLQGLEGGGCLLLAASAGPRAIAEAEANAIREHVSGHDLGADPWERWLRHRFDLSVERLRDLLDPPGAYVDTIEVAASWTELPELYSQVKAHLAEVSDLALCHFSHGYAQGCCAYFTFLGSAGDESKAQAAYREAWRGAMDSTIAHRGTISHHHGTGQVRAPWIRAEMGGWWTLWERVRRALDPEDRLNPNAVGGLRAGAG